MSNTPAILKLAPGTAAILRGLQSEADLINEKIRLVALTALHENGVDPEVRYDVNTVLGVLTRRDCQEATDVS